VISLHVHVGLCNVSSKAAIYVVRILCPQRKKIRLEVSATEYNNELVSCNRKSVGMPNLDIIATFQHLSCCAKNFICLLMFAQLTTLSSENYLFLFTCRFLYSRIKPFYFKSW
jgi:hypothetical protein